MKLWHRKSGHEAQPSMDARAALWQAKRALLDAERLDCAAQEVERRLRETKARNHFAEAVIRAVRRA